jgi:hypothetical protein
MIQTLQRRSVVLAAFFILPLLLGSCKRVGERMEIRETRPLSEFEPVHRLDIGSVERFTGRPPAPKDPLLFDLPEGWSERERSQMRPVNLAFGPDGEGECYLAILQGGGGDLLANVNRWRKQMGQDDIAASDLDNLPQTTLMRLPGVLVTLDGDYTNIGDSAPRPDYSLVGVIATLGEAGLFVKMTGPRELVAANRAAFDEFIASLRLNMSGLEN